MNPTGRRLGAFMAATFGALGCGTGASEGPAPIAYIEVSPASVTIAMGETVSLSAVARDVPGNVLAGRVLTWTSADVAIATVNANGLVTSMSVGTTTISASADGRAGATTVTVSPTPVGVVSVSLPFGEAFVGQTLQASATVIDVRGNAVEGRNVLWSTGGTNVATVSASGLVTAVGPGSTYVTATCEGKSGSSLLRVLVQPVAVVQVRLESGDMFVGGRQHAIALVMDASGNALAERAVAWTSSDAFVASVSSVGDISAIGVGTAAITATAEGRSGSATVRVSLTPVASVAVSLDSPVMAMGGSTTATAELRDALGNALLGPYPVDWTSSDPTVAAILSTAGRTASVNAVGVGTALVRASTGGRTGSAQVRVEGGGSGQPTQMSAISAVAQTMAPGGFALQPPAVVVRDVNGSTVAGVDVIFLATSGGGAVSGTPTSTDASGVARAASWTFGATGAQTVQATSPAMPGIAVTFSGVARDPADGFDVNLWFGGTMMDAEVRAFVNARERIQEIVLGDLPPASVNLSAAELADCGGRAVGETIDDVLIIAEMVPIDGVGGILGQAGPCYVRSSSRLPIIGHMQFDAADIEQLKAVGRLDSVILHEMMHVIGFGTIWSDLGLLAGAGTGDPRFPGANAVNAFRSLNDGTSYTGSPVPVEATGGQGTANSHWRETVFGSELMTGWISGSTQRFSATTAGALADLGYTVDLTKADPFSILSSLRAAPGDEPGTEVFVGNDIRPVAPIAIDEQGVPIPR